MSSIPDGILDGIAQGMFPCGVVYASRGGETLHHDAFGAHTYADGARPCGAGDLFDLASLTKLYTATVALRLVEDGTLRLDEPVRRRLPEVDADWSVEDLLGHRTGTTAALLEHAVSRGIRPCVPGQEAALWQAVFECTAEVELAPGESHYSDVDFLLLQAVCERATGRGLDVLIGDLGFDDTMFNPAESRCCVPTEVDERWRGGLVCGEVHDEMAHTLGGVAGHAGLFATAEAVGRFCEAWLQDRLLSGEMRRRAFTAHSDQYGLGWRVCNNAFFAPLAQWGAVGHLGFTGTSAFIFPATQTVFVLLSNRVHPHRDAAPSRLPLLREIARALAGP